jgi:hypothetical protein
MKANLDDECGRHFRYRDFVECSETWWRTRVHNVPQQPETYLAISDLVATVLDPLSDHLGRPVLTYAFSSPALTKLIKRVPYPNISQPGDQHASCELNTRGTLICTRRGMAVDIYVPGVSSFVAASWVVANTAFDRLYFYSEHRPFHVSAGPEQNKSITIMRGYKGGRHSPSTISANSFLARETALQA